MLGFQSLAISTAELHGMEGIKEVTELVYLFQIYCLLFYIRSTLERLIAEALLNYFRAVYYCFFNDYTVLQPRQNRISSVQYLNVCW